MYNSIIKLFSFFDKKIKKILGFSHFLCHFCKFFTDFPLFQENYEGIFEFYREKAFI